MTIDMTTGKPVRKIITFLIPIFLGNLLQQAYNTVDSIVVSRFLGVKAFAGVTATGPLNYLIIGFATGLCAGCGIPMAQAFGAGDHVKLRRYFANTFYLTGVLSVVLAIVTFLTTRPILNLIATPPDIIDYSATYISIIFLGLPATMLYNTLSSAMYSVGDGKTPLIMLIVSSTLHVCLDVAFVVFLKFGIAGVAVATIFSQLVSGILCLIVIIGKFDILKIRKNEWGISFPLMSRVVGIGIPMGLQCSITAIGTITMQGAVNSLGSDAVAAFGAGSKIQSIYMTPVSSLGTTIATYTGQNFGAHKLDRIRQGIFQMTGLFFLYCIAAYICNLFTGNFVASIFVGKEDLSLIENTMLYVKTILLFFPFVIIIQVFRNAVQGLGYSSAAMFAGIMEVLGRLIVVFVLVRKFGYAGSCFSSPIAWICADLLIVPMFFILMHKESKKTAAAV